MYSEGIQKAEELIGQYLDESRPDDADVKAALLLLASIAKSLEALLQEYRGRGYA